MQRWYNIEPMIIRSPMTKEELHQLILKHEDFIKIVVDIEREIMAVGGELHSDDEQVLLEDGSRQKDLWGANYFLKSHKIRYYSMINIRPSAGNSQQEIQLPDIRSRVKEISARLFDLPVEDDLPGS